MIQQKATIAFNTQVAPDCFHLGVACDAVFSKSVPGQFVMVQAGAQHSPLLRRPFSICGRMSAPGGRTGVELLVKVVGQGTRLLAGMTKGQRLDILGPLGRGFRVDADHRKFYLAAGGIGIAPLRFMAFELLARGVAPDALHLFLGGRSQADLLCRAEFQHLAIPVTVTTDDGSDGDQCLITDPLETAILQHKPDMVYACGPHGMLACIAGIARRCQVACQVSIESMMACGMGVCLGCAVESNKAQDQYLHACIHGPVFDVADLNLES
jgi:dihydroorotate dehydrogenase electron transfer subunit